MNSTIRTTILITKRLSRRLLQHHVHDSSSRRWTTTAHRTYHYGTTTTTSTTTAHFIGNRNGPERQIMQRRSFINNIDDDTKKKKNDDEGGDDDFTVSKVVTLGNENENDNSDPSATTMDPSKHTEKIEIRMPDMGEGANKIVQWYKQEGDIIETGDILCDIETPDFTFGMTSDDECDAIMGKIIVPAGEYVPDEEVICVILHPNDDENDSKQQEEK